MASRDTIQILLSRYGGASPEMLDRVLRPYRLKIDILNPDPSKPTFRAIMPPDVWTTFETGTTGKVIPREHVEAGAPWREVLKGRILKADKKVVEGELYFAPSRLAAALKEVKVGDYIEIDPFGVSSKVESALCEASFFIGAQQAGFDVVRMPENVAMHIGTQNYYDFRLERKGSVYRVELKSLWGTDTTKARLIHTVSRDGGGKNSARSDRQVWSTSSCRFRDQDFFAVSMWLRTGRVSDFALAVSIPNDLHAKWGLPKVPKHPSHVTQNPNVSEPPQDPWTMDLNEICDRIDYLRKKKVLPLKPPSSGENGDSDEE